MTKQNDPAPLHPDSSPPRRIEAELRLDVFESEKLIETWRCTLDPGTRSEIEWWAGKSFDDAMKKKISRKTIETNAALDAWRKLPDQDRNNMISRLREAGDKVGARLLTALSVVDMNDDEAVEP